MSSSSEIILVLLIFALGGAIGSFFKLVVDRYSSGESFIFKSSYCPSCKKKLYWWQNIPVFSYLLLGGKCFFCKNIIDVKCFISELLVAIVSLVICIFVTKNNFRWLDSLALYIFSMTLIFLSMFDLKHRIVPHLVTYSLIILVIVYRLYLGVDYKTIFSDLGCAFILLDILFLFATWFKKFELDSNLISLPIMVWSIILYFAVNIKLVLLPITAYFILVNLSFSVRFVVLFWAITILSIMFQLYRTVFIDFNDSRLILLFSGIGIIYLVCEVSFYFLSLAWSSLVLKFGIGKQLEIVSGQSNLEESEKCDKKYVLGGGDITIFALISVFMGFKTGLLTLFLASFLAVIWYFIINFLLKKMSKHSLEQNQSQYIAFVPYITSACFIIILSSHGV